MKEPKKYVYNCLSFVSNSDATDVAKYIEDLHQIIAQNNEELDEYIKKIVKLKERMEDKDKEIERLNEGRLKSMIAEKDAKINKLLEEHFEMFGDMKEYKNLWLAEQRKNKEICKQVCDELRDYFEKFTPIFIQVKTDVLDKLDQIEKGE